jgi:hypothetical protein
LYINNRKGHFTKSTNLLPKILNNSKGITAADFDQDGDVDLFIGSRVIYGKYPLSNPPHLLQNNQGHFKDVTSKYFTNLADLKMINDALFTDYDNDGDADLIVVGEWMPICIYENVNHKFIKKASTFSNLKGWYQSISETDVDNNGLKDYIIGNWGDNNKFHPTPKSPLHLYAANFDNNNSFDVVLSKEQKGVLWPVRGKQCSSEQNPYLKSKIKSYQQFAEATLPQIYGKQSLNNATHLIANHFKTVLLKQDKPNHFVVINLAVQAQFSPTLSTLTYDFNHDGLPDIFGVGNVYDTEVETIRYDASKGYILLQDNNGNFNYDTDISYFNDNEAKSIKKIIIKNQVYFIIKNKNTTLKILKLNSP